MKSRLFVSYAAIFGFSFLAGLPALAATQVTLSSAAPTVAEPGLTTVRLLGSGFPIGLSINPANIQIHLVPQAGGSATLVAATQYQAVAGTLARVAFLVPASLSVSAPTPFTVSLSDATDGFPSSNSVTFTVDPSASISLVNPDFAQRGQTVNVTITGNYTNFLSGSTQVSAGSGITAGIPTVASATSLTAQFVVATSATLGVRNVIVTTGGEVATSVGGFTVQQVTATVPNVVGDTQAAATTAITGAGLTLGTVTPQASNTVVSGNVISESPAAGTGVNAGSAVNLVVSSGPAKVTVPNVVGDTQAVATTAITGAGLILGIVTPQASNTVVSGNVISESPAAGSSVVAGSGVNLVVSSGPAKVTVPNVVGDTQAVATTAITGAGLILGTVKPQASNIVVSGNVISESPAAGTGVDAGSGVNLVVSSGPAKVTVPNVVGDTQAVATTAITGAGLILGTVTPQASNTVVSGNVISENPAAGTGVDAGSAVNLVVSTGPAKVTVPNVVGDTQAAATTAITGAGLVLGTVTQQASSTVASGNVISESPTAGTSVNVGSAVNLVVSSGPASAAPVTINLQLDEFIITAGASITFTDVPVDQNGNPVSVAPACAITPDPISASGTAPAISNGEITTSSSTRGVYTLTCSLTSPSLMASASFTVLLPTSTTVSTTQQATFSTFSATTTTTLSELQQINAALTSGNQTTVNTVLAQLQASLNAVDFDALDRAVAFAPEGGFPAAPSELPGFGIFPTAADANVGAYLTNLIAALQELTTFLQTTPLATLTSAQKTTYSQLETALSTLVTQLPSLNPSTYGVVANLDQEDYLFSDVLPQYYQALVQATIQYLTANGFTAGLRSLHQKGLLAADASVDIVQAGWRRGEVPLVNAGLHSLRHARGLGLAFQFGGLIELEAISEAQMNLIQNIYGPYFAYLAKAAATMAAKSAFDAWAGSLSLDGVITGADSEVQIFYAAPSEIEGDNLNSIAANNKVYLVGPDQINAVTNAVSYLQGLHPPKDLNDLDEQMEGFVDLFKTVQTAYNEMTQPPDSISFGGCLLGNSPPCVDLNYKNGFNSVYQPGGLGLPAAVLVFVQNKPAGVWSTGIFEFSPAATQ